MVKFKTIVFAVTIPLALSGYVTWANPPGVSPSMPRTQAIFACNFQAYDAIPMSDVTGGVGTAAGAAGGAAGGAISGVFDAIQNGPARTQWFKACMARAGWVEQPR